MALEIFSVFANPAFVDLLVQLHTLPVGRLQPQMMELAGVLQGMGEGGAAADLWAEARYLEGAPKDRPLTDAERQFLVRTLFPLSDRWMGVAAQFGDASRCVHPGAVKKSPQERSMALPREARVETAVEPLDRNQALLLGEKMAILFRAMADHFIFFRLETLSEVLFDKMEGHMADLRRFQLDAEIRGVILARFRDAFGRFPWWFMRTREGGEVGLADHLADLLGFFRSLHAGENRSHDFREGISVHIGRLMKKNAASPHIGDFAVFIAEWFRVIKIFSEGLSSRGWERKRKQEQLEAVFEVWQLWRQYLPLGAAMVSYELLKNHPFMAPDELYRRAKARLS